MKKQLTLEDWFVELRIISVAVIASVISITAKSSWYYFETFSIEIDQVRAVAALFFGCVTGLIVSLMSFHKKEEKKVSTSLVFYIANIILTALILKVFTTGDPKVKEFVWHPTTFYIERIFLSLLLPSLEYAAVTKWKQVYSNARAELEQNLNDLKQIIKSKKQKQAALKQKVSELKREKADILEKIVRLKEGEIKRTCPDCKIIFSSSNGVNAHKCNPKKKIINNS